MGPKDKDELSPDFWEKADKIVSGVLEEMKDELDSTYIDAYEEEYGKDEE